MQEEIINEFKKLIKYLELSVNYIDNHKEKVARELKIHDYYATIDELKDSIKIIKEKATKWYNDYKLSKDILCISLKEYKLVKYEASELVTNSLLIDELGSQTDEINYLIIDLGAKLSEAIESGGNIDNVDITNIFDLFITSLDKMINDEFYSEEKENIIKLKELVLDWNDLYNKEKTITTISYENMKEIYELVLKICDKYKMIEDIEKNYAENIQYCYIKLEALRKAKIEYNREGKQNKNSKNTLYDESKKCFFNIIGYINMILQIKEYEESYEEYNNILKTITTWMINYDKTEKLSLINHKEILDIYKKTENLAAKHVFDISKKDTNEYSDYVANWLWDLMYLRKMEIEKNGVNDGK